MNAETLRNNMQQRKTAIFSGLRFHIILVLVLKLALLTALWLVFVKPLRVNVNVETMGARIAGTSIQTPTEENHDRSNSR